MASSKKELKNYHFSSAGADIALAGAYQQLTSIMMKNVGEFGIIDRAGRCFLLYKVLSPGGARVPPGSGLVGWPSLDSFLRLLSEDDCRFVADTVDQVHEFLHCHSPASYPNYRLSLDLCLRSQSRCCRRVLVHLFYLAPDPQFPNGLCLFQLYHIGTEHSYLPPLHSFCTFPGLEPVLFKSGSGHMPRFSVKMIALLDGLAQGLGQKQLADHVGYSVCTVNNMLSRIRKQLHLANNTQLIQYANYIGCI